MLVKASPFFLLEDCRSSGKQMPKGEIIRTMKTVEFKLPEMRISTAAMKNCSRFPLQTHLEKVLHIFVKIHWRRSDVDLLEGFLNQRIFVAADGT